MAHADACPVGWETGIGDAERLREGNTRPCRSMRAAFGPAPIDVLNGVLDQAKRGSNGGKPYRIPARIAEPSLHVDSWTVLASYGQMHEPDRLGCAAAAGSGYSRDGNCNLGPRVCEGALRH